MAKTKNPAAFLEVDAAIWPHLGVTETPIEHRVRLRTGGEVRVNEVGEGPPVLFVHGASVGAATWAPLIANMPGFRCLALNRPGCALSDPVPGGGFADLDAAKAHADDMIADVLDALEVDRAHVVATSYGGFFAFRGAAAHPERIDRLVTFSWSMGIAMEKVPVFMRIGSIGGMERLMTKMPVTPSSVRMMLKQIGMKRAIRTGTFDDEMVDWMVTLLRETDTMANDTKAMPKVITPIKGLNRDILFTDELLSRVTMPTHLIWGDEDPNGGGVTARQFLTRLPNATLEVWDEAGHAPFIDDPVRAGQATSAFLGG